MNSLNVGGRVPAICQKLLNDSRQRVVVDGAAIEWTPVVSGVPLASVLGSHLFILHTSEIFDLLENRMFAYAVDSTFLAVVVVALPRPVWPSRPAPN